MKKKDLKVLNAVATFLLLTLLVVAYLLYSNYVFESIFETKKPTAQETTGQVELVSEYKEKCKQAVEEKTSYKVQEEYIFCDSYGVKYYCKLDSGKCLRYTVDTPYKIVESILFNIPLEDKAVPQLIVSKGLLRDKIVEVN